MSQQNTKRPKRNRPLAVALQYDGKNAPQVTATGSDRVALMIERIAKQHDIPCQFEPILAEILSSIDEGTEIPENLYRAVAEVIAFAYILSGKVCDIRQATQKEPHAPGPLK